MSLRADLRLALDGPSFAEKVGITAPDPWQERLLRSSAPRVILNCHRQSGKSTVSGVVALRRALYRPRSLVLCLAPSERQSKELFGKIAGFYRALHDAPPPESDRKLGMVLPNGSRIEALPGSEKTIRGFSGATLLLVDEAARVDDELYYAVRPMLAVSGGALVMLSTPYGKRGAFYEEWTGRRDWERYEVPATMNPRITPEFLAEEREALPSWVYRQEYECSFEETEDQIFTTEMVEAVVTSEVTPLFGTG